VPSTYSADVPGQALGTTACRGTTVGGREVEQEDADLPQNHRFWLRGVPNRASGRTGGGGRPCRRHGGEQFYNAGWAGGFGDGGRDVAAAAFVLQSHLYNERISDRRALSCLLPPRHSGRACLQPTTA